MLDAAVLWRNEREREAALSPLLAAFELKMRSAVQRLEDEVDALAGTPMAIGHIAIGCALGYLDYRFEAFAWRATAPRLAAWYAQLKQRESFRHTEPVDG